MPSLVERTYALRVSTLRGLPTGAANADRLATYPMGAGDWAATTTSLLSLINVFKQSVYLLFAIDVPPRSTITRAKLVLTPSSTAAASFMCRLGVVLPDGRWNRKVSAYPVSAYPVQAVPGVVMRKADLSSLGASWGASDGILALDPGRGYPSCGASVKATATGTMASATMVIGSSAPAAPPAQVWLEVWSTVESSPAVWSPSALLAYSDRVLNEDLNGAPIAQVFTFTGSQQITIASGTRYHLRVRTTQTNSVESVEVGMDAGVETADSRGFGWSDADGLTPGVYAVAGNYPHPTLLTDDNVIPGRLVDDAFTGAAFDLAGWTSGVPISIGNSAYSPTITTDLAAKLQSWVGSTQYVDGALCLVLDPTVATNGTKAMHSSAAAVLSQRPQLTIEWEVESRVFSGPRVRAAINSNPRQSPAVSAVARIRPAVNARLGGGK